jgi:hypothetical protein
MVTASKTLIQNFISQLLTTLISLLFKRFTTHLISSKNNINKLGNPTIEKKQ